MPKLPRSATGHVFTIALGVLGWAVVLGLPLLGAVPAGQPVGIVPVLQFIIVILAARALALMVSHYTIQGARQRLLGQSWRAYVSQLAIPGMLNEGSLMPIGVVLVLLYDPAQPLGFLLLSLTYLLINLVFARLSRAR